MPRGYSWYSLARHIESEQRRQRNAQIRSEIQQQKEQIKLALAEAKENAIKNATAVTENSEKVRIAYSNLQKLAITTPILINFTDYKRTDNFSTKEPIKPYEVKLKELPTKEEYKPNLSIFDYLIKSRKEKKILESNENYEKQMEYISRENARIINENDEATKKFEIEHSMWVKEKETFNDEINAFNNAIDLLPDKCKENDEESVEFFCNKIIEKLDLSDLLTNWYLSYSDIDNTLVIDYMAPDANVIPKIKTRKFLVTRKEYSDIFLKEEEILKVYENMIYSLPMKIINDIYISDVYNNIKTIVFNIEYTGIDSNNGKEVTVYIYTIKVNKDEFLTINIRNVSPKLFLKNFGGSIVTDFKNIKPVIPAMIAKRYEYIDSQQTQVENLQDNTDKKKKIEDKEDLNSLLATLQSLVGLQKVKSEVNTLVNAIKIRKLREEQGLKQSPMSLHLVFSGNPGTGKTTVARILSKIYKSLGVLKKGHLIEVDRSGLVAGYIGQTALKVQDVVNKAMGGVLFIDEAYSLTANRGESDFGLEAVDTLLKAMEDNRDKLIVIVAGYSELMEQFLISNPGLKSRFNTFIHFEDYNPSELYEIFITLCKEYNYKISLESANYIQNYFVTMFKNKGNNFANGRDVRNYFEKIMKKQSNRLACAKNLNKDDLLTIILEDCKIE